GYSYTALRLSGGFWRTVELSLVLVMAHGLVLRWLFVVRRRVALDQARKRVEQQSQSGKKEGEIDEGAPLTESDTVRLAKLDQQTRGLLRTIIGFVFLLGVWWIWKDLLPALQALDDKKIWGDPPISVANVITAVFVATMTLLAARNLPGTIQIAILDRLPMAPSSRYAVTTVCTYAIVGIGIGLALSKVGLGWDRVQWLVAAMGVGLGFGLQEIFANFVSGLILLFEQPIRIGDVVTVGSIEGKVTRIRMRATTITDYDRRELVVPNKDFITGQLINWTLSDQVTRVVFNIGVAYGSDTQQARDILMEIAEATPTVADDPPPHTLFRRFGDSTLDLELRVYIPTREVWISTVNAINAAIDARFKEAGIEIAFPQRDIHIRSGGVSEAAGSPAVEVER
ncbi:MAG: mechanosensitive ion channel, partial [Planctomycetes bacterium]|nr:mechanosensitive ion channel [Planctomycetota bacterium]